MDSIRTPIIPWLPVSAMTLVSLISYIDRNTLALLAPTILAETGLSNEQYGYIVSAFSVTYMIGNPVWGLLLDRFGLRWGMAAAVAFWSAASTAHALASGFLSFAVARATLGFGEGATFPGGLRTATQVLPPHLRSRGIALAYSGGSLGAVVTPLIVTPIALAFGWRGAFVFTGLIGLLWLVLWMAIGRFVPPHVRPEAVQTAVRPTVRSAGLWAFMSAYALGALPLAFVLYSSSVYLSRVRGVSQAELGRLLWIPPVGWEVGYFFWGWIADRYGPVSNLRARVLLGVLTLLSLPLAATPAIESSIPFMLALLFAMFVAAGFVILSIAYANEVFTMHSSGLIAGLGAGSWSAAVAVFMPFAGRLFDARQYETAFLVAAAVPVSGYLLWLFFDRRRLSDAPSDDFEPLQ
jgi:ACS family hexuronate transporter-like MFS transporter